MVNVKRTITKATDKFCVGDIIEFNLPFVSWNNVCAEKSVEAMAVKTEKDGMLFILTNCLDVPKPILSKKCKEHDLYENSYIRDFLNFVLLKDFPEEIRERMLPMEYDDYIRLATKEEIFGVNGCDVDENDNVKQFEAMKLKKNRIVENFPRFWWLQTKCEEFSCFALVDILGHLDYCNGNKSRGIRPIFKLKN